MLRVSDLRVRYGRIEVLHRISFEAKAGEVTCLIGPNGAGKTTTLWTLAGVLRPAGGQVHFMDPLPGRRGRCRQRPAERRRFQPETAVGFLFGSLVQSRICATTRLL